MNGPLGSPQLGDLCILILEDHPIFLKRLASIIDTWPRCARRITCATVAEAIDLIECNHIDLLLADLLLPDGSGVDVVHKLRVCQPNAQSLVISALAHREVILQALRSGATGYIHKEDSSANIIGAMEQVIGGGSPLSPSIAREILNALDAASSLTNNIPEPISSAQSATANTSLTPREQEVLRAISRGYTNREVAALLSIAEATVPVHVRNIYRKLEVNNRTAAVFEARKLGLIDD